MTGPSAGSSLFSKGWVCELLRAEPVRSTERNVRKKRILDAVASDRLRSLFHRCMLSLYPAGVVVS